MKSMDSPKWNFVSAVVVLLTYFGIKAETLMAFIEKHIGTQNILESILLVIAIGLMIHGVVLLRKGAPVTKSPSDVPQYFKDLHKALVNFAMNPDTIQISIQGKTGLSPQKPPHFEMVDGDWKQLIEAFCEKLGVNILYYRFGEKYRLIDLASGEDVKIPTDITKNLTLQESGLRPGMVLELREIKK